MERFIDFDAARAERERKPVVVRLFGEDWKLFTGLPASVMLEVLEAKARSVEELSDEQAVLLLRKLVPSDVLDAWLEHGLIVDELLDLMPLLMRAYMGKNGQSTEDDAGEAETPSASPSSSVSAGGSSKPTSAESTASTSTKASSRA